ncbi:hypothetical protein [Bacillus sp. S1-R1J2-FB]|uniref:hypothetical protein n=1 Tax=Bacillus sp. S1-R1J2-FB TaxID=1973494 RepID=UPI000A3AF1DC|nr:hypothetical protein [Bacillus sp. S1-R1J2-FB]
MGQLKGSVKTEVESLVEVHDWSRGNKELLEVKKCLSCGTGGIGCEKLSGWLCRRGYGGVSQLHVGVVTCGKSQEVQGELSDGRCYVFDERIGVPGKRKKHVIVSKDNFTVKPCESN